MAQSTRNQPLDHSFFELHYIAMKLQMQTFTSTCGSRRFTFYETWFTKTIAIVKEELWEDEWSIKCSMSIPKALFSMLEYETTRECSIPINSMKCDDTIVPVTTSVIYDRFELPASVREVLFRIDCQNIPTSENQLGCFSDLETLEWYWNISASPGSPREETFFLSPQMDASPSLFECETPVKSTTFFEEECPPAPKKLRSSQHEKPDFTMKQLDLEDL